MGKSQEFKATVNFGAAIDPSFGSAVSKIGETMKDAADDAARSVNKLTKEQEKLHKKMKQQEAAGKDVSKLKVEYDELSKSIEKSSRQLSRLNTLGKAGTVLTNVGSVGMAVARPAMGAAMLGGGAIAGIVTGAIAMNAETATQLGKAQGYGLDFGTHMAYQGISKAIGLDEDSMGDLLDEMKNKIGEAGNEKMLDPLLAQVGLNKKSAQRMMKESPDKLFNEVISRLNESVKTGKMSVGEAGSFADQLLGGEAQKIISYMASLGMSLEELTANSKKYNLVTEEGARQAVKGQYALNSLWGVVTSGFSETTARILGAASTDILQGADYLKAMIEKETPEIVKAVTDWFAPDKAGENGPQRLWDTVTDVTDGLIKFGRVVNAIADKLEWLIPDEAPKPEDASSIHEALALSIEQASAEADKLGLGLFSSERGELIEKRKSEAEQGWRLRNISMPLAGDINAVSRAPFPVSPVAGEDNPFKYPIPQAIYRPSTATNNTTTNNIAPVIQIYPAAGREAEDVGKELEFLFLNTPSPPSWDGS